MTFTSGMAPAQPGEVLLGKYRVEGALGQGGMGVVMRATHLQLGQPVALKFLWMQSGPADSVATDRFLREARATFRLKGENSVRVLDVGTTLEGIPFIVMEMLEGKDLRQLLNDRRSIPAWEAVGYILQVCGSLEEAHSHGIVHRDLKPRNLFLTTRIDGSACVKVLDFGISKVKGDSDENPLTNPQMALGSPRYMAPEQWMSSTTVDARADIYATSMVLYELITGQVALAGLPLGELIRRLSAGAIPSPRDLKPDLPEPLCKVVLKALRPHPEERYPTIQEFAGALREVAPPKPTPTHKRMLAQTAATAIVDKDVMLARAALSSALGPRSRPTPEPIPPPPPTPIMAPAPTARPPFPKIHDPVTDDFELKTTVSIPEGLSPPSARPYASTMQSSLPQLPQRSALRSTLPVQQLPNLEALAQQRAQAQQPPSQQWQQQPQHYLPPPPAPSYSQARYGPGQMQSTQPPQQAPMNYSQPAPSQQYYPPQHPPTNPPPMAIQQAQPQDDGGSRVPWLLIVFVFVAIAAASVAVALYLKR